QASACLSPGESCPLTAAGSNWLRCRAVPASGSACRSKQRSGWSRRGLRRPRQQAPWRTLGSSRSRPSRPGPEPVRVTTEAATRALVVEDDPNIVDLIRSNLAVRGFDTVVSADGLRALRLLETESPDIVLLDLMLPEIDGFELCRQIRERSSVAIIVVSARGGERGEVCALKVGADGYLTNPFTIEQLPARITAPLRPPTPPASTQPAPATG